MGDLGNSHVEVAVDQSSSQVYWNHLKTVVLVLALSSIYVGQLILLVGGGLLARNIAAVVGGASLTTRPTAVLGLMVAALGPPVSQIADYLGAIFGLLIGGVLTRNNNGGFRTYFYISAGIFAAAALACTLFYHPPPRETQLGSVQTKLRQLDWVGFCLVGSGVTLLCFGLSYAQNPYPWTDAHVLAPFLIGVVLLFVLVGYEWKVKKDGLFDHRLFRNRNFPICLACVYIEGGCAFTANYFVPFQLSILYPDMSTFQVGLCYSVSYMVFILFALAVGLFIWKTKSVRTPVMAAFVGMLLFFILAAVSKENTPQAHFWGYMVFLGGGLAFLLTTLVVAAQLSTPPELIAITSGLVLSIRSLGASTGLVIYQAVFNRGISAKLVSTISAATLPLGLPETSLGPLVGALTSGNSAALSASPGVTPEIIIAAGKAVQKAYTLAFSYVWATAAVFAFIALIGAALLVDPKSEFTAAIDAPLDIVDPVPESIGVEKQVQ